MNTVGSGFCSAAYTIHLDLTPTPSETAVPAAIPAALLLQLLIVACLLPEEEHRDTAAGVCAVVGAVALVTVIVGWCRAEEPLLFAGCFFSLIMAESLVIALVYACNDPNMTGTAYAVASCCYLGQHRTIHGLRLFHSLACIKSVIFYKFPSRRINYARENLFHLTNFLTAQLSKKNCAVVP